MPHVYLFTSLGSSISVSYTHLGGCRKCFLAENRRHLMLSMPVGRRAAEYQNHDVGPIAADHPDHVGEDAVVAPFFEGLGAVSYTHLDVYKRQ